MRRTVPLISVAAVAALVLTGCTGGGGTPTADDWANSPLNRYLAASWGGDLSEEEQERRYAEQQRQSEEIVAECMAEQGFDYKPVDYGGAVFYSSDGDEWNPDSREWVAQWGYGAVNWPGKQAMEEAPAPEDEWVDPNQDYVESLSGSEQQAYYEARYGPPQTEDELIEDGSYEWNWETAGCQGLAQNEVYGSQQLWNEDEFADLFAAMERLWQDIENDPRNVALDAEWSSCMADAGYSGFTRQYDAQQSIYDEMNVFWENGPEWDESLSEEEMTRIWEEYDKQIQKEMEPLAEKEVALALADLDCREKTDYRGQKMKIQFEIEEQFVSDHKAELEAFKAAAEQRG